MNKSMNRTKSILKERSFCSKRDGPGSVKSELRVRFKPKKKIIFFRTASSVLRFKKNLLKKAKKKKERELLSLFDNEI